MTTERVYGRSRAGGERNRARCRRVASMRLRASAASASRQLAVRQFLGAAGGQNAVAVEQFVDLTSAVALAPPQRTKYRPRTSSRAGHGETIRLRGIEGQCIDIARLQHCAECPDIDDLDHLNRRSKDPFELSDACHMPTPEWQGTNTHDDDHDLSFCAQVRPPGGIMAAVAWERADSTAESTRTLRRPRHGRARRRRRARL